MPSPKKRVGQTAGKNPTKSVNVQLTESKYTAGGAKARKKKGGVIRKPMTPIRGKRSGGSSSA